MDFFSDTKILSWKNLYKDTIWLERRYFTFFVLQFLTNLKRIGRAPITHTKSIKLVVTGDK